MRQNYHRNHRAANMRGRAEEQGGQRPVVIQMCAVLKPLPKKALVSPALGLPAAGLFRRGSQSGVKREAAMTDDELRQKNARLRDKIREIVDRHPELGDLSDEIALEQSMHVEVGTPFLERANGKLQERARAIIERRPDLEPFFAD